ncbi:DUF2934 domain-containing protein [Ancylobacter oerskovii]|uniref:DUF2934 domain-containing protein n=1 Tax=Ancylobacter oerskovii TaxID=459519 RepID=A0ABW4Z644_9HYPH|nr:DUF2934 domain-containing protein [Ancylobacter oerskovii]MBS7543022.1 DUF2934 domain-containing protein [Ancylobacter oerskovii]
MAERNEQIRQKAHKLWEEEGRPEGQAERHWLQAKKVVVQAAARRRAKKIAANGASKFAADPSRS